MRFVIRRKFSFLLTIILLGGIFVRCTPQKSLDEEVKEFCDCLHELDVLNDPDGKYRECVEMRMNMVRKYQFDPEASEEIQDKIRNCTSEI